MFKYLKIYLRTTILALFVLTSIAFPACAVSVDDIPQPPNRLADYIVDLAEILNIDTEAKLNSAIATLEKNKNKTVYIVLFLLFLKVLLLRNLELFLKFRHREFF